MLTSIQISQIFLKNEIIIKMFVISFFFLFCVQLANIINTNNEIAFKMQLIGVE